MPETPSIKIDVETVVGGILGWLESASVELELFDIFQRVTAEFHRARELHGDQTDRPLGTGPAASYLNDLAQATDSTTPMSVLYYQDNENAANLARKACEDAGDDATWAHIAGEEFFEALAEEDPAKFEVEAIQTIAMLVNAILAARKVAAPADA